MLTTTLPWFSMGHPEIARFALAVAALLASAGSGHAQWPGSDVTRSVNQAIERGVVALEKMQQPSGRFDQPDPLGGGNHNPYPMGSTAFAIYTLCKSGARDSATIPRALTYLDSLELDNTYNVSALILALDALRDDQHQARILAAAQWLAANVERDGLWGYPSDVTDLSNSQLAVLALWTARQSGFEGRRELWIDAINGLVDRQNEDGGFGYHQRTKIVSQRASTGTMTTAGATILWCALDALGERPSAGARGKAEEALARAWEWLERNFTGNGNPSGPSGLIVERFPSRSRFNYHHYYFLWGVERIASLANKHKLGGRRWYREGAIEILKGEDVQHGWGSLDNTCFALLFLRRATYTGLAQERRTPQATLDPDWRYTFEEPADDWAQRSFEDSAWRRSAGGFGKLARDTSAIQTRWETESIWLRRWFSWPGGDPASFKLRVTCDDEAQVFVNGELAGSFTGLRELTTVELNAEGRTALQPGRNLLAIRGTNREGVQIVAAQLELPEANPTTQPEHSAARPWFWQQPAVNAVAIRRWQVAGPLKDEEYTALNGTWREDEALTPAAQVAGSPWKEIRTTTGVLDFAEALRPRPEHAYYAFTYLDVREPSNIVAWVAAQGGVRAYLDGETILAHHRHDEFGQESFGLALLLDPGLHRLLFKLNGPDAPQLDVRLSTPSGELPSGVLPRLDPQRGDDAASRIAHVRLTELSELHQHLAPLGKRGRVDFAKARTLETVAISGCDFTGPRWRSKTDRSEQPQPSSGGKGLVELVSARSDVPMRVVLRATLSGPKTTFTAKLCGQIGGSGPLRARLGILADELHWEDERELNANDAKKSKEWHSIALDAAPFAGQDVLLVVEVNAPAQESVFIDEIELR